MDIFASKIDHLSIHVDLFTACLAFTYLDHSIMNMEFYIQGSLIITQINFMRGICNNVLHYLISILDPTDT